MHAVAADAGLPEDHAGPTLDPHRERAGGQQRRGPGAEPIRRPSATSKARLITQDGAAQVGGADAHHGDGADVVADAGLGGEVMHPRDDEQVAGQAGRAADHVEEVALGEVAVGDENHVSAGLGDDAIEVAAARPASS